MRLLHGRLPRVAAVTPLILAMFPRAVAATAQEADVQRSDSAGVEIVVSHTGVWGPAEGWVVSGEPTVSIGAVDGAPEYLFRNAGHAVRLAGGGFAVADFAGADVRVFDAEGRFVRTLGREGEGPGEFRRIWDLTVLPGDTVVAYDFSRQRMITYTADGDVVRDEAFATAYDRVRFSRLEGWAGRTPIMSVRDRQEDYYRDGIGLRRTFDTFVRPGPDGFDSILTLPGQESFQNARLGGGRIRTNPLAVSGRTGLGRDRIVHGVPDGVDLAVYDLDGRLRRRIRVPALERELRGRTLDSIADLLEEFGQTEDDRRFARSIWEGVPTPERWPPFSEIHLDREGNIWLRPLDPIDWAVKLPESWAVIAADGRYLGQVEMPAGLVVKEIGPDYVLGTYADDFDVPYVRMYALRKREGGS